MSASLRDLKTRVDALPTPAFDADLLSRQAGTRVRRRQAAAWVAVGVVVALIGFGAATLRDWTDHSAPPAKQDHHTHVVHTSPVRQVTFGGGYWPTTTIHYGNRTVDLPKELSVRPAETGVVHMDVTDDGVAFTIATAAPGTGRGVWFTDGVTTHRIGRIHGYLGIRNNMAVVSGTSGSRVAWIESSRRTTAQVVVYDTSADHEVVRVPVPACTATQDLYCVLDSIVGEDHVYFWVQDDLHRRPDVLMRLDASTGAVERVTTSELAADLASTPRSLILGGSPQTGLVTNGYGVDFVVRGAHLVPMREELVPAGRPRGQQDPVSTPTRAFDTGTHKQIRFRLPAGSASNGYTAFEWLDDDRLALMNDANGFHSNGETLVCQISTERCNVVVAATPNPHNDSHPVVPHLALPG